MARKTFSINKTIVGIILILSFIFSNSAYAYIDPGIGSMMFQIAIAFIVSAAFIIKRFFLNIKTFVRKIFKLGD